MGYDCSLKVCSTGDDPLTINQFNEKQIVRIYKSPEKYTDSQSYFALKFRGHTTVQLRCADSAQTVKTALEALPTIGGVNVKTLDANINSLCGSNANTPQYILVEFTQDFGDLPPLMVPVSTGYLKPGKNYIPVDVACTTSDPHYQCQRTSFVADQNGIGSTGIQTLSDLISVRGTKEEATCSNRGICESSTGVCACSYNFVSSNGQGALSTAGTRGDCGFKTGPVVACPGSTVSCSGHGVCSNDPEYICKCDAGWEGGDCSLRSCPMGRAWFDVPIATNKGHQLATCSNAGLCDYTNGKCTCDSRFTGEACQRQKCNTVLSADLTLGAEWLEPGVECNGHGRCLPMGDLAMHADINGVPQTFTYGFTPNDWVHWDYQTSYGCLCDAGWEGGDCSLRSCPTGDNPDSYLDKHLPEIQSFTCQRVKLHTSQFQAQTGPTNTFVFSDDSKITLTFRSCTTASLRWDASPTDVVKALEDTTCIGKVSVTYLGGATKLCGDTTNTSTIVTFNSEKGDLPQMTIAEVKLNPLLDASVNFTVQTIQNATTENEECSLRGVCDHTKGQCQCFAGWASSDGNGNAGSLEDCGHRLPFFGKKHLEQYQKSDEELLQQHIEEMGIKLWDKYNYKS